MTKYKYLSGENFLQKLPYNVSFDLCRNRIFYDKYFSNFVSVWAAIDENYFKATPYEIALTNDFTQFIKLKR